jgi:hypothetical protein
MNKFLKSARVSALKIEYVVGTLGDSGTPEKGFDMLLHGNFDEERLRGRVGLNPLFSKEMMR